MRSTTGRRLLRQIGGVLSGVLVLGVQAAPPNIVLMMTDDQGFGDLGATGNTVIETPHIDAMAQVSARMTRFYVSPVCSPTRASLMTGRYNYRTRAVDTFRGRSNMDPEEVTVAEVLKAGGYATGIFGKWHLGDCYPMRAMDQGYDEALVHNGGGLAQPADPLGNDRRYTDAILMHNGEPVQTKGYCTDVYFDAAMAFAEKQAKANKPFFAYVATNAPHGPFHDVPADLLKKYSAKDFSQINLGKKVSSKLHDTMARIAAMIENVDENVGRMRAKLEELGIADNTVVIFMVDNGPNGARYVGNMRGKKAGVNEGSIRSPFFVVWPAVLEPGDASAEIAAHIDVMPTLLEMAGVASPKGVKLDGKSLLPLLKREEVSWPKRFLVLQAHRGDVPAREHHFAFVTDQWKLLRNSGFGAEAPPATVPFELYDLLADPMEQKDRASDMPGKVAELRKGYNTWYDDVSSTRPDNYAPPRIVIGTKHEPKTWLTMQDLRASGPGWGTSGFWPLRAPEAGTYRVELHGNDPLSDGVKGLVRVAGKSFSAVADDGVVVLEGVAIAAGDHDMEVVVERGGKESLPWQVSLSRSAP